MILIEANINIKTQEFYFFNLYVSSYFLQGLLTSKPVRIPIYDYKERILMPRLVLRMSVCGRGWFGILFTPTTGIRKPISLFQFGNMLFSYLLP